MKENKAEIVAILDRSGSMSGLESDVIGGFNNFVQEQREVEGEANLTLVLFDSEYDVIHDNIDLDEVPELTDDVYYPRGSTALLDAIGRTIDSVGDRLRDTPEEERPENVIFFIFTDGYENASTDYNGTRIKQMIEHQQEKYSWNFLYAGANQDAFAVAGNMGINTANTMNFANTSRGYDVMYSSNSMKVANIRNGNDDKDLSEISEDDLEVSGDVVDSET